MYLEIDDPKLHCSKRKVLSNYEEGEAPVEFLCKVEEYYRQLFYQATDMVIICIRNRFQLGGYIETL